MGVIKTKYINLNLNLNLILIFSAFMLTGCLGTESNTFSTLGASELIIKTPMIDDDNQEPTENDIEVINENSDDIESGSEDESDEDIDSEEQQDNDIDLIDDEPVSEDGPEDSIVDIDEQEDNDLYSELCNRKGNIISNGSFEVSDRRVGDLKGKQLDSINNSGWDIYQDLPGKNGEGISWYTSKGAGIEVQGKNTVTMSPHGNKKVELDSHSKNSNSSMSQDIILCKGKHVLRFLYYPRTKSKDDNNIVVNLNGKKIVSLDKINNGKWLRVRKLLHIKKSGPYKLTFSAEGKSNSLGGLIDKVRLHRRHRRAGVVTSLLALGDMDNINNPMISEEASKSIVYKLVNFASIHRKPNILIVRDSNHNNESSEDFSLIEKLLIDKYGQEKVRVLREDLRPELVGESNVIMVINPGHPLGSPVTAETLRGIINEGHIGVILSGDDMARGKGFNIDDITGVKYLNNGTQACGVKIDNNLGDVYKVRLKKKFFKGLTQQSRTFNYGNDIDHVERIKGLGVKILAKAQADSCGLSIKLPVIFGYKLKRK